MRFLSGRAHIAARDTRKGREMWETLLYGIGIAAGLYALGALTVLGIALVAGRIRGDRTEVEVDY